MSAASRTTVGGYHSAPPPLDNGQFSVCDDRSLEDFCNHLRGKGLEPVLKNTDSVYRGAVLPN